MLLVLLGPPGCGKGTISSYLLSKGNFIHISTGDLIREEIKIQSDLAKKINDYVLEGKLVPDEITNELLKKKLLSLDISNSNIILDGYPRNESQAKFLETILNVNIVLNIKVDENIIIKRITGRRICPKCNTIYNIYFNKTKENNKCDKDGSLLVQRTDDNEVTIKKRIKTFNENNIPLLNFYKSKNLVHDIENDKDDPKYTFELIDKILKI